MRSMRVIDIPADASDKDFSNIHLVCPLSEQSSLSLRDTGLNIYAHIFKLRLSKFSTHFFSSDMFQEAKHLIICHLFAAGGK